MDIAARDRRRLSTIDDSSASLPPARDASQHGGRPSRLVQLAVDAAGKPAYVLTITNGLQAPPFSNDDDEDTSDGTYGSDSDHGYESEGYGSETAYGTTSYEGDTVASGPIEGRSELAAPIALGPEHTLTLRCTVTGAAADTLECTREPADDLGKLQWRFRRPGPDEPSGV